MHPADDAPFMRLAEFGKQLVSLSQSIASLDTQPDATMRRIICSAIIHDFELSFELCWKAGQELGTAEGYSMKGPRDTFIYLSSNGYVAAPAHLTEMINMRNRTTHAYIPVIAETVVAQIIATYYGTLTDIHDALSRAAEQGRP